MNNLKTPHLSSSAIRILLKKMGLLAIIVFFAYFGGLKGREKKKDK
jgi:hypothetical protein